MPKREARQQDVLQFEFGVDKLHDFQRATRAEWLEANGLGGWASSTIIGAHTRRYHGLLVAAIRPPVGRYVLLSKLDETLEIDGQRYDLGCNRYPGVVHPTGHLHLRRFRKHLFPVFEYQTGLVRLQKTVASIHGENTTLIIYTVLEAPRPFSMELLPLIAGRDFHSLMHANSDLCQQPSFDDGDFCLQPYEGLPAVHISVPDSDFRAESDWYYNLEYGREQERGLDFREDLFAPGRFRVPMDPGATVGVIISTRSARGRHAERLLQNEQKRRTRLLERVPGGDGLAATLTLAADQFIVRRAGNLHSIIAGYHWFSDWGRDTMIALPGICLATGHLEEARDILRSFSQHVSEGMLPNHFPDSGSEPVYNTVDATLWFFVAVYAYLDSQGEAAFVRDEIVPVLLEIIDWHERGTRYGIHVAADGLLTTGADDAQLTWMDARVGDWTVTPRSGKAVEINALWYNALAIAAELCRRFDSDSRAESLRRRARRTRNAFRAAFWYSEGGYLYDVIDGDRKDASLRPNQLVALSLPFALLSAEQARSVLKVVRTKLLTPRGLRSLSADDARYRPRYEGDPVSRDSAYHQGTVWTWLIGPLVLASIRYGRSKGVSWARKWIDGLLPHLREGGIGTISEVFDGDPPHRAGGCIAQAWSVAEVLRAYMALKRQV